MLPHLLLMRHAKSSWSDGSLSDHERPLNDRGRRAANAIGAALTARGYAPDVIWSSDAEEFYHASAETVLRVCGQAVEPDKPLMLLGHNPGWAELHQYFTGQSHRYPTGACTVLTRKKNGTSDWLNPAAWAFTDLILPRELDE